VHILESTAIVTHFVCISFANPVPTATSVQSTDLNADNSGRFVGKSLDFSRGISSLAHP